MKLTCRNYQSEDDFWSIRSFLREIFLLNNRHMSSWPIARWDYWRWHGILNLGDGKLEEHVFLWETEDDRIAAVLNCEGAGQAFLQVHPALKSAELEQEMILLAETTLHGLSRRGGRYLWIWTEAGDNERQTILQGRGFKNIPEADELQLLRSLEIPIPDYPIREGYIIRSLGDAPELPARSWASWRAFHPNEPDDKYDHEWLWYQNIQSAPLYRRDLDLVAIAPVGDVAAFTTIWYDDVTRCGYFEPVGTVPEHQRQGLARSLLSEGMRRLKKLGATLAMTIGGEPPANCLYQAVLGPVHDINQPWEKRWE